MSAACARHESIDAVATCARCGDFLCPACVGRSEPGLVYCAECAVRIPESWLVPWEDARKMLGPRVFGTFREGLSLGKLRRVGPGRVDSPVSFAFVAAGSGASAVMVSVLAFLIGVSMLDGNDVEPTAWLGFALFLVGIVVLSGIYGVASTLLTAGLAHVVARALGGRAPFSTSLRAVSYALAGWVWPTLLALTCVCSLGGFTVGPLIVTAYQAGALHGVAERRYGLSADRALLVALVPVGLFVLGTALLVGLTALVAATDGRH